MGYTFLESVSPDYSYVKDKERSAKAYYNYLLLRCLQMFEYKNLPDTIDPDIFERYLLTNGVALGGKDGNGDLRVFFGNWGGIQDVYYRPSQFIVANPHIGSGWQHTYQIYPTKENPEIDGILFRNDTSWYGLHALLSRYACMLAENTLTMRISDVMLRITALLTAPSDKEAIACEAYMTALEEGEMKVIAENPFFDGIKMQSPPSNNGSYLTQFIEFQQYLKGSFFNEIGLSANYNMKREAIGKGESTLDSDALLPLCENMLKARREDWARFNELFGTNVEVNFSSAWLQNSIESKLALLQMSSQASQLISASNSDEPQSTNDDNNSVDESELELCEDGTDLGQDVSNSSEDDTECNQEPSIINPELEVLDNILAESIENIGETSEEKKEQDAEVSQLMAENSGEGGDEDGTEAKDTKD